MGNFLSSVGRARPTETIDRAIRTEMAIEREGRQKAIDMQSLEMGKEQLNKIRFENKRKQEEAAWFDTDIDVTMMKQYQGVTPESQKRFLGHLQSLGVVDERGIGKRGRVIQAFGELATTREGIDSFFKPELDAQKKNLLLLQKKRSELMAAGKEKEAVKLDAQINELSKRYGVGVQTVAEMTERAQKLEDEQREHKQEIEKEQAKNSDGGSGDGPVFKQKIKALMGTVPGITEELATKIITGTMKILKDPVSKEISIVDLATGEVTKPSVTSDTEKEDTIKTQGEKRPKRTLWDMSNLGTGPMSAIKSGASRVSGMVGGPVAGDTIQARQFITSAQNDLIRSLSINPRFPVGEIKRIKEEINISPSVFDNSKHMKNRMIAVENYLLDRVRKETKILSSPSAPSQQRQASFQAITDINHFLEVLGVPPRIETDVDFDALEPGQQFFDPNGELRTKPEE